MPDKETAVRAKFELWVEQHPEEAEAGPRRSRAQETGLSLFTTVTSTAP